MKNLFLAGSLCCFSLSIIAWRAVGEPPSEMEARAALWAEMVRRGEPQLGSRGPEFHLESIHGGPAVSLTSLLGQQPLVLIFGSHSCPQFRESATAIQELCSKYENVARFQLVYVREAHPDESGAIQENEGLLPFRSAHSLEDRKRNAATCSTALNLNMPILVDDLDNSAARAYRSWPERAYVLDRFGKILYKGVGPGSIDCIAISRYLESLH